MTAGLAAAEAITTQQVILLGAVALILVVLLAARRQRRVRDGSPKQYRREIDSATAQSETVKRDMGQLLTELEELSRKINGQIDANLARLRETTLDADRRITALRTLIAESRRVAGEPGADRSPARTAEPADTPVETADHSAAAPPLQEPPVLPEQRRLRVYQMADRGLTPVQIARELQAQPGEIELILNLRKVES